jgi:hypothetical protein
LLDEHRDLAFVSHWVHAFGDDEFEWKPVRCDLVTLLDRNAVNGAAVFRRSLVDAIGGFDESLREGCEDWEFWLRVLEAGYGGAIIPEALYEYRQRLDSMSRTMNRSGTYQRIYEELVEKHRRSYERHLLDLVLRREWTFADVCLRVDALEQEIATRLEPALSERRFELRRAQVRLAALEAQRSLEQEKEAQSAALEARDHLERERNALAERVAALEEQALAFRDSWSWRVTSPGRRLYERLGLGDRSRHDQ